MLFSVFWKRLLYFLGVECTGSVLEGFYSYPSGILIDFYFFLLSIIWNGAVVGCRDSGEEEMWNFFDLELNKKTFGEMMRFCHHFIVVFSSPSEYPRVSTSVCSSKCKKICWLKVGHCMFSWNALWWPRHGYVEISLNIREIPHSKSGVMFVW
jgi:hypothetical protein